MSLGFIKGVKFVLSQLNVCSYRFQFFILNNLGFRFCLDF